MPLYDYVCGTCDKEFERRLSMSDVDLPLSEPCPFCKSGTVTKLLSAPAICDPVRMGVKKPPADFQKYVLGKIQQKHPLGNVQRKTTIPKEV